MCSYRTPGRIISSGVEINLGHAIYGDYPLIDFVIVGPELRQRPAVQGRAKQIGEIEELARGGAERQVGVVPSQIPVGVELRPGLLAQDDVIGPIGQLELFLGHVLVLVLLPILGAILKLPVACRPRP